MAGKDPQEIIAETKALLAENERLNAQLQDVIEEVRVSAAKALNRNPATFDFEEYLRETLPPAEFERLREQVRSELEARIAQPEPAAFAASASPSSVRPAGARPHRRMV